MRASYENERGARLRLPFVEKVGDGGGIHVAHVSELRGFLRVDKFAVGVEDGESRHSLLEGNFVFFGDVQVFVEVADIDVDKDEILFKKLRVRRLVEVDVENLAVAAPVAAEVENDALALEAGLLESGCDVGLRVGLGGVEMLFDCRRCRNRLTYRCCRRCGRWCSGCGGGGFGWIALAPEGSQGKKCGGGKKRDAKVRRSACHRKDLLSKSVKQAAVRPSSV
jgi:hypothetical protein